MAQLEAELNVDAAMLAYCPDAAVAQRYRDLFNDDGLCLSLRPLVFTPDDVPLITDLDAARASPAKALFAAVLHGHDPDIEALFPVLKEAVLAADPGKKSLYFDALLTGLPEAARRRWEALMTTSAEYEYRTEFLRESAARGQAIGQAIGEAIGEARAILTVLDTRGVTVPDEVRERILTCGDTDQIHSWLVRATTATTVGEVIRE